MRDCGVAALAMVFGYYSSYYSFGQSAGEGKNDCRWNDHIGLVKVAEELGFETRAFRADRTLWTWKGDLSIDCPRDQDGRLPHYVVYKKDKSIFT